MGSFEKKGAVYHYQFYNDGRKHRKSMQTGCLKEAKAKAKNFEAQVRRATSIRELELLKVKNRFSKINDITEVYIDACKSRSLFGQSMELSTALRNVRSLEILVGDGSRSSSCLTPAELDRFAVERLGGLKGNALRKARNTIESTHRKARSVFADWVMRIYKDKNLLLPDVTEWKKHRSVKEDHGTYRLPIEAPELCDHIRKKGRELLRENHRLAVAWLLCYELALRAKEASHIRWNWFVKRGDHFGLLVIERPDEDFSPKGTNREIQVHREVFEELKKHTDPTAEFIAHGKTKTERYNYIVRELAEWLRGEGFDSDRFEKASHELRKLKGSEWFSDPRLGASVAQEWLGHKDISTTCKYYAALDRKVIPPVPTFNKHA